MFDVDTWLILDNVSHYLVPRYSWTLKSAKSAAELAFDSEGIDCNCFC